MDGKMEKIIELIKAKIPEGLECTECGFYMSGYCTLLEVTIQEFRKDEKCPTELGDIE